MSETLADWMTKSPVTLTPDMTLKEMDTVFVKCGISGAPVVERRKLVGVVSQADAVRTIWEGQRDAARAAADYASPFPVPMSIVHLAEEKSREEIMTMLDRTVREIMTPEPLLAHPDDSLQAVCQRMAEEGIHRLPVVDRASGELVGIVTSLDLVGAMAARGLAQADTEHRSAR